VTSREEQELIEQIGLHLDGEALVRAIGFHIDKMRILGNSIKTPCFVHGDSRFATLLILPEKHAAKCMVSTCPAFAEASLVRLVALWKGIDELDAALEAAHLTGLQLAETRFDPLLESWLATAKELVEEGKHQEAQALFARAARLAPHNVPVLLESARASEEFGNAESALKLYVQAAHAAMRTGQPEEGLRILREDALRLAPTEREVLEEVAWAFAALDRAEEGALVLMNAAAELDDHSVAQSLADTAREVAPKSVQVELKQAQLLATHGEVSRAVEAFLAISDRAIANGDVTLEGDALKGALSAAPERTDLLDRLVAAFGKLEARSELPQFLDELAARHGDSPALLIVAGRARLDDKEVEAARPLFQRALAAFASADDSDAARALYEELVSKPVDGGFWREGFADWLSARGEIQAAISQLDARTDQLGDSPEEQQERLRLLERMVQIDSFAPEIRRRLAKTRAALGQPEEAESDYLEAVRLCEEQQKDEERLETLEEYAATLPGSDTGPELLSRTLIELGREDDAIKCLQQAIVRRQEAGLGSGGVWLHERLQELRPDDLQVQAGLARAHEESGNETAAVDAWRSVAEAYSSAKDYECAANALAEAIRVRPDDLDLRMQLLDVLDAAGDDSAYHAAAMALLKLARTASETSRAEAVIRRLNEKFPDDVTTAERMAELEIGSGRIEEGCDRLRAAANSAADNGDHAAAARLIRRILDVDLGRSDLINSMVVELEKAGSTDQLLESLLHVAGNQFVAGNQPVALDCIARYEARAGWQWDRLVNSCNLLIEHGLEDRALATIRNFLKSSGSSEAGMLAACEYGLEFAGDDRGLAERLLALQQTTGAHEKALLTGLRLASIHAKQGDRRGAIAVLESLKEKYPAAREPRLELTRLYEESSRKIDAKHELVAIAAILVQEARLADACTYFQRALALEPADFETGLEYADCLERLNDRVAAAREVKRLCHLAIEQGNGDRAKELFARVFELLPDDMSARGEYVDFLCAGGDQQGAADESMAIAHRCFLDGNVDAGIQWARKSNECLPDSPDNTLHVAGLLWEHQLSDAATQLLADSAAHLRSKGRLGDAGRLAHEGLEREKEDPRLLKELAEIALAGSNMEEGLAALRRVATAQDEAGNLLEAEHAWRRVLELSPDNISDHEEFIGVLQRQGPSRKGDALDALKRLCATYLSRDMRADAITCYQRQLEIDPQLLEVRSELAHACFEEGRYKEATQQFMLLAASYRQAGRLKLAIDYLGKVIELDPQNLEALQTQVELTLSEGRLSEFADYSLRLASLLESAGRTGDAIAVLRKAVDADRENLEIRPIFASYLLKSGEVDEGLEIFIETARRHMSRKEKGKAIEVLDRARSVPDASPLVLERLAEQYLACGEKQTAQSLFRTVAERAQQSCDEETMERVCGVLVGILMAEGKTDEAVEWQLDLARLQVSQGMVEKARELLDSLGNSREGDAVLHEAAAAIWSDNGIPELAAQEYLKLARLAMDEEDWQTGRTWCGKALEGRPREIAGREMLATCLKQLGETQKACEVLGQLADAYEDALQPEGAADVLGRIVELQPEEPSHLERLADALEKLSRKDELAGTLRILAQVHEKRGDLEKAIESLRRLKTLRPDDTRVRSSFIRLHRNLGRERSILEDMVHLANLHVNRGDRKVAFATLHEAVDLDPTWPDARERLLSLYLEDGQNEQAIETALALVETHLQRSAYRDATIALQRIKRVAGGDPRFHLAQANIHMAQNTRGMALREYEEAAKLFAAKGDLPGRTASMARIIEIDPQNLEVRHDLIDCLRQQGKMAAATEAQRQLAEVYCNRGLWDLAEAEYRDIVSIDPQDHTAWQALFNAHLEIGDERDLIADYMQISLILEDAGDLNEAIHYLGKVITLDPQNIEARQRYIGVYKSIGSESELTEDYLRLADLLIEAGRIDEGIQLYNHVMTIDPGNTRVRERLSETQVRIAKGLPPLSSQADRKAANAEKAAERPAKVPDSGSASPKGSPMGAAEFLAGEIESLEKDDQAAALEQVIASYRDILAINAQNANVRIKLADLYLQQNERDKALEELRAASETLLNKGELAQCIAVCERILKFVPTDQKIRNRLKQAFNKRDAFKALESAILFSDGDGNSKAKDEPPGEL
jgi:tetratricopeptide (TPR) repeat protein